ncbi:hypothetical protein CEH05_07450 [Halobacillus halophilus]|uniref:hypothetical protein n=1 Tax=Halobacillus halophilus TaxID=1570 RepID=UPI0002E9A1FA|nr:hypothetical protein [Halobacillus halophilus]ASF38951.1 hypothetical protein CEH05_07430 [Halobacillus halophilus]ASF38954.1 hypothetical protein CEH05_07450 [Halobacillus halophilus]
MAEKYDNIALYVINPLIVLTFIINLYVFKDNNITFILVIIGLITVSIQILMMYRRKEYKSGIFTSVIVVALIIWFSL